MSIDLKTPCTSLQIWKFSYVQQAEGADHLSYKDFLADYFKNENPLGAKQGCIGDNNYKFDSVA